MKKLILCLIFLSIPASLLAAQNCTKVFNRLCKHNKTYECFELNFLKFEEPCQDKFVLNPSIPGNEEGCSTKYTELCLNAKKRLGFADCISKNEKILGGLCIRALINERKVMENMAKNCAVLFKDICPFKPKKGASAVEIGTSYMKCVEANKKKIPKNCQDDMDLLESSKKDMIEE